MNKHVHVHGRTHAHTNTHTHTHKHNTHKPKPYHLQLIQLMGKAANLLAWEVWEAGYLDYQF